MTTADPSRPTTDPAATLLGYLNFSSGAFDPTVWQAMNDLFAQVEPLGAASGDSEPVVGSEERPDAAAALETVTCPVLLLVGSDDRWSPRSQHEEIAAMVLGPSKVVEIAGAGHFLPYEKPKEVAAVLSGWLARYALA